MSHRVQPRNRVESVIAAVPLGVWLLAALIATAVCMFWVGPFIYVAAAAWSAAFYRNMVGL